MVRTHWKWKIWCLETLLRSLNVYFHFVDRVEIFIEKVKFLDFQIFKFKFSFVEFSVWSTLWSTLFMFFQSSYYEESLTSDVRNNSSYFLRYPWFLIFSYSHKTHSAKWSEVKFLGMSSYGPKSSFFEKFIISGLFFIYIMWSYSSYFRSYDPFSSFF